MDNLILLRRILIYTERVMSQEIRIFACVVLSISAVVVAYTIGSMQESQSAYTTGYQKGHNDTRAPQINIQQQAVTETVKTVNPFAVKNPLAGVEINPFEKVKKVLNPFE